MNRFDFLVLGGGPAGNQTAFQLSKAGYSVLVIDYRHTLGDKPCSGIVGIECVERYDIPESFVISRRNSATFHSGRGKSFELRLSDDGACIIDRVAYVQHLADKARSHGTDYLLGATVRHVEILDDGVVALVKLGESEGRFFASAVVVATGFNSQIARSLGMPSAKTPALAAQSVVSCPRVEGIQVYSGAPLPTGWFGWIVPTGSGFGLLGVLGRGSPIDVHRSLAESLAPEIIAIEENSVRTWGVPLKPALSTYSDRVVLVGDVAGHVKPTTGGGIYYSLRCADIAADVLVAAGSEGDFSAERLVRYETEWKALLASELSIGYMARRAFEAMPPKYFGQLINIASKNGFLRRGLQFEWHSSAIGRGLSYAPFKPVLDPVKKLFSSVF